MNKNFAEWYRIANIEPTSERLENRWSGITYFIENQLKNDNIFELVKMFYSRPTQEEFREKFVECFVDEDSVFDRNNELELSILAGTTLVEIIENYKFNMLPIFATISFSFSEVSPVIPSILKTIKETFIKETCSTREEILDEDDETYKCPKSNEILKVLDENQPIWTSDIQGALIEYITETSKYLKDLGEKEKYHRKTTDIYAEDSQILWWMMSGWCNDLDKPFHKIKQVDASPFIGKELADKIKILPGPYSAKAVIHKMLECCNKKNKCKMITLKDIIENLDATWKIKCLKEYDINGIEEITPIMFAISKSLTVDEGEDWNPQFKKIVGCRAENIIRTVEEMAFQMYLECLTIKCYNNIEE